MRLIWVFFFLFAGDALRPTILRVLIVTRNSFEPRANGIVVSFTINSSISHLHSQSMELW